VTEMRIFRWMYGETRMERIKIEYNIRGILKVALVTEKMRSNRLAWYGYFMWRDKSHIPKRGMS
jgi:hypothetical protein